MKDGKYYRVYIKRNGNLTVITVQWFDEYDINSNRYETSTKFNTELDAWLYILEDVGANVNETDFFKSSNLTDEELKQVRKYLF